MKFYVNESENRFFVELQNYLTQKGCDLFLVQAEYKRPGTNDMYSDFAGFDIAFKLDPNEAPIIFCSFVEEKDFVKHKDLSVKFFALMSNKRTGFIDIINQPEEFYAKYLELVDSKKDEDILAVEINRIKEYEKTMGHIQHAISGRISGIEDPWAIQHIKKAREVGVTGTDEEVLNAILNFKQSPKDSKFVGKYFPGIFCDLEGTLFINSEVNSKLIEKLKDLSLVKPITLWTAGDVEEYQKKLISKGIMWKLVSKTDFFGAEVEIAYDDLSYENFHKQYGIKVREFHQVTGNDDETLGLKLVFLHSLLIPSGVSAVLNNPKFSPLLDMSIESKKIREYLKEMENEKDEDQYNQFLIILRDFLVN